MSPYGRQQPKIAMRRSPNLSHSFGLNQPKKAAERLFGRDLQVEPARPPISELVVNAVFSKPLAPGGEEALIPVHRDAEDAEFISTIERRVCREAEHMCCIF